MIEIAKVKPTLIAALCFAIAGARVLARPEIAVDEPVFEFGEANDSEFVERCFAVRNRGDEVLAVERIEADCAGCLSWTIETNRIGPGGMAILAVSMDPESMEGDVEKRLLIRSNDSVAPVFPVAFVGRVTPRFRVRPKALFFGEIAATSALSARVIISGGGADVSSLTAAVCDKPFLKARIAEAGTNSCALEIETVPPVPEGFSCGRVTAYGSAGTGSACTVRVGAYVRPAFLVLPDRLVFVDSKEEQSRVIFVRQNRAWPAAITGIEAPPEIRCEAEAGPGEGDYRIYCRTDGFDGRRGRVGQLAILTDDPERGRIALEVFVDGGTGAGGKSR